MALSSDARNRVLYEVFGRTDNVPVTLTDEPWLGYLTHAESRVDEIRKWYAKSADEAVVAGESSSDSVWSELVELEFIERLLRQFRSVQDAANFRQTAIASLLGQITSTYATSWGDSFGDSDATTTPDGMRSSVIAILLRQEAPVFPSIDVLDRAIYEEHAMLWDSRHWRFRRSPVWMEIATDGAVTIADTTDSFDGIASKIIYIKGTNNVVTECQWQDSTRWAHLMASYANETTTGRPKYFYLIPEGSTTSIQWLPEPDTPYQAFCVIYTGVPDIDKVDNAWPGLEKWPPSFRMHLRDRIVARMLMLFGSNDLDAKRWSEKVEKDYRSLLAEFDVSGSNEWNASYFKPARFQQEFRSFNGRFMGGMG